MQQSLHPEKEFECSSCDVTWEGDEVDNVCWMCGYEVDVPEVDSMWKPSRFI